MIVVGNIIASPKRPVPPLIAASSIQKSNSNVMVAESTKTNVEWAREKALAGNFGIWTKFVESIGLNSGAEYCIERKETFKFDNMETVESFPNDAFLETALRTLPMRSFWERHGPGKSLYVIVGTKTVSGVTIRRSRGELLSGVGDVGLDLAATGVPVSVGPSVEISSSSRDTVSFEGSSDFVFAFRVRRIRLKASGIVLQDDYNRGALFGNSSDDEDEADGLGAAELEDFDYFGADTEYNHAPVTDGNETVEVYLTK